MTTDKKIITCGYSDSSFVISKESSMFHLFDRLGIKYKYKIIDGVKCLHYEDGHALEYSNGDVEYYLENKKYSKEDWELELIKRKLEKIKSL